MLGDDGNIKSGDPVSHANSAGPTVKQSEADGRCWTDIELCQTVREQSYIWCTACNQWWNCVAGNGAVLSCPLLSKQNIWGHVCM